MRRTLISMALSLAAFESYAENLPKALPTDSRIKQVKYRENDVIPIHGKTFTNTQIQFADKEEVLAIEGGDTTAWMVTYHPELSNMIFIKPTIFNSSTNMTVITNQHAYYFHLSSNKKLEPHSKEQTYTLKFTYAEPPKVVTHRPNPYIKPPSPPTSLTPKVVNSAYRFSGSPQLVPRHVFDDGKFTYFELNSNGAVPAIFAVDEPNGKESTVNVRREGKYLIVQRLAPQFTLRQGGLVTSVFNNEEINRIHANRRPK